MQKISILFYIILSFTIISCSDGSSNHTSISGSWRCEEYTGSGTSTYLLDIDRLRSDTSQYMISNFYNMGDNEFIVVKLKNGKLSLTQQPTSSYTVKSFSGTVKDLENIALTYTIYDGQSDVLVNANYSR